MLEYFPVNVINLRKMLVGMSIPSGLIILLSLTVVSSQLSVNDDRLNWCLDSQYHKTKPGPESELYSQCTPWKNRSCCTHKTTKVAHHGNLYNFTFDHCSHIKSMSPGCRKHFIQDLCFYECSPNVGPWVVQVNMKVRKQRFHNVPLCQSDCDAWFKDCAQDYTCGNNWIRNWDWVNGSNKCPKDAVCKTILDTFGNAKDFCEKVWDESWRYTPDDEPCMRLWFDGSRGNPNDKVAQLAVLTMQQASSISTPSSSIIAVLITSAVHLTIVNIISQ